MDNEYIIIINSFSSRLYNIFSCLLSEMVWHKSIYIFFSLIPQSFCREHRLYLDPVLNLNGAILSVATKWINQTCEWNYKSNDNETKNEKVISVWNKNAYNVHKCVTDVNNKYTTKYDVVSVYK